MSFRVVLAIVGATVVGIGTFVGKNQLATFQAPEVTGAQSQAQASIAQSMQTADAGFGGMSGMGFSNRKAPASVTGSKGAKFVSSGKPKPAPARQLDPVDEAVLKALEEKAASGDIPPSLFEAMKSQITGGYRSLFAD